MARRAIQSKQTHTRAVTTQRLDHLAADCGAVASFLKTDHGWDWSISRNGQPLFQGCAEDCYIWLQGFVRGLETVRKENINGIR